MTTSTISGQQQQQQRRWTRIEQVNIPLTTSNTSDHTSSIVAHDTMQPSDISTTLDSVGQDATPSKKVIRTRTGCLTCRRRKKKCDEQRCPETGGCQRCKQAGYQCEGFPRLRQVDQTSSMAHIKRETLHPARAHSSTSRSDQSTSSSSQSPAGAIDQNNSMTSMLGVQGHSYAASGEAGHDVFALHAHSNGTPASSFSAYLTSGSPQAQMHGAHRNDTAAIPLAARHLSFASTNGSQQNETPSTTNSQMLPPELPRMASAQNVSLDSQGRTSQSVHGTPTSSSARHRLPAHANRMGHSQTHGPAVDACSYLGECILGGRGICEGCIASIEPLFPDADQLQHFQLPTTSPQSNSTFSPAETRHQPVMQSLIGYYSAVATCWIEGVYPQIIAESAFFRDLVQGLLSDIDQHEPLRLSVAAVASGYIGGGQLQWPEDLVAIQRWTQTLRQDASELQDVTNSASASTAAARPELEKSVSNERLRRHAYIDRHLSKHAMLLYRMARRSVEEAIERARRDPSNVNGIFGLRATGSGAPTSSYVDPAIALKHNSLLLACVNLIIFAWAETSTEAFYDNLDLTIQAVHTLFGGARIVRLAHINAIDTLGLLIIVWADTCAGLARGLSPYFEIDDRPSSQDERREALGHASAAAQFPFNSFNSPPTLWRCFNELARLRFDCQAVPARRRDGRLTMGAGDALHALPAHLAQRANQIDAQLNALVVDTQCPPAELTSETNGSVIRRSDGAVLLHRGSPNCGEMTRLAAQLFLYTSIYGKGPMHPTCKQALQNILHLWTYGAMDFCRAVGCSNYLLPVFMASAVAYEARDRFLCAEAINLVGHDEAIADASRRAVKEIWRRTDEVGFPLLWTDVVHPGGVEIGFL